MLVLCLLFAYHIYYTASSPAPGGIMCPDLWVRGDTTSSPSYYTFIYLIRTLCANLIHQMEL
jgi:hypothetical protein